MELVTYPYRVALWVLMCGSWEFIPVVQIFSRADGSLVRSLFLILKLYSYIKPDQKLQFGLRFKIGNTFTSRDRVKGRGKRDFLNHGLETESGSKSE